MKKPCSNWSTVELAAFSHAVTVASVVGGGMEFGRVRLEQKITIHLFKI
jgi:hypothetical protein